ncbi:hypothetical protein CPB97_009911 [Podila verticillata]|nr:hypothetical protein CPB97_009911 [Podila verticillata]
MTTETIDSGQNPMRPLAHLFEAAKEIYGRLADSVKRGYSTDSCEIPSLDTFDILWSCDPDVTGDQLSKDTIGILIDKAIGYLQDLSPPKWGTRLRLTYSQSAAIKFYLDVQDGDNADGNLSRQIESNRYVSWVCRAHNYRSVAQEDLDDLKEFVNGHGGHVDIQQAVIQVELGSVAETDMFCNLLKNTSAFDISIKLTWKATPRELFEGFSDFPRMSALVLEVDGFATDIHRQDHNQYVIDFFYSFLIDDDDVKIVAFLNYPSPQEHRLRIGDIDLRLKSPPESPFYDWEELRSDFVEFGDVVAKTHLSSECETASRQLQVSLEENGLPEVTAISVRGEGWVGVFDLKVGAFVEVMTYDMNLPEVVISTGSVRKLVQSFANTENDQELFHFVHDANGIQELDFSTYGSDVLSRVEFIGQLCWPGNNPLRITLFDYTVDIRGRNVAQIVIHTERRHLDGSSVLEIHDVTGSSAEASEEVQESSMVLEFTLWDRDYSLSPLSDFHASFLDMATFQHPSVLTSFTLDVSSRSVKCMASIQNIVSQSSLEHLVVMCSSFDNTLSESIVKILQSIPWHTLKSLVLMGDGIDEWIQIWPRPIASSLLCLQIRGTGSMPQDISHSSVLFVLQLVSSCPLSELQFENIQLKEKNDWVLIVDSLDPSLLGCFCLCEPSSSQLLATVEAVDLFLRIFKSNSQDEMNRRVVHQTAFNLDINHLSFLGLIHAENVLSRSYNLVHLSIVCSTFEASLSVSVARVFECIPWTTVKSLVLSGDYIDEWIRLCSTDVALQLHSLEVRGAGSTPQELTHAGVLSIQNLVIASPLEAFTLENILLQDKNDWIAIIESVDPASLREFKLCEHSKTDLLTRADAADLYKSKFLPEQEVVEDSDIDVSGSDVSDSDVSDSGESEDSDADVSGDNGAQALAEALKTNSTLTTLDLQINKIGDKGAQELAETLKINSTLTTLDLQGNSIGGHGAQALSEALKINSTLTTLEFQDNKIGDNGAQELAETLKINSTLTTLDLQGNSIGDNGAQDLAEALKINSTVTTLDLQINKIGDKGAQALAEALKTNLILTTLLLQRNSIGDNGAQALSEALKINWSLTTLDLRSNKIGFEGALVLILARKINVTLINLDLRSNLIRDNTALARSEAFKTNSTRNILDLQNNSIRDGGAQALSMALKTNSTLTALNLAGNMIRSNEAQALSEALKTNSTLTILDLQNNSIGDNGAQALSEALRSNSTLTTLDLWGNLIGSDGALVLSEALKTNCTLTSLYLQNNSIRDDGSQALAEALKTNSTLTTLDLWGNSIGDKGAQALSEALKTNSTLVALYLQSNSIGSNGGQALSEALKSNSVLTTLNFWNNSIGDIGAQALAEALKTNSALAILILAGNLIGDNGALALSEALKINLTLVTLELKNNLIQDNGAQALRQLSLSIRCIIGQ